MALPPKPARSSATLASSDTLVAGDSSATDDTLSADQITQPPADGPASPQWRERAAQVPTDPSQLPLVAAATYTLLDEVGRGGLGRIVRARDARTGRIVAIKEMRVDSVDAAARFVREALVTANLQHPAIVPVYEVGRWPSGQPFYAMKLVTGRPLSQVIDEAPDLDHRLALVPHVIAVADALAHAHGERVIHRDLKPGNVMVGGHGETVVIDWGLARRLDQADADSLPPMVSGAPGETVVGSVLGTPQFMAPEQSRGERVDERADVYAIGAILYHTLAGRPPFDDLGSSAAVLDAVRSRAPAALATLAPGAPRDLLAIVERAMARDVDGRYPTAAALATDLRRFATGQLVSAHRYSRGERVRRLVRRHRGVLAIAAAAAIALAATGVISVRRVVAERETARIAERGQRAARTEAEARNVEARDALASAYVERARHEISRRQPAQAVPLLAAAARLGRARADVGVLTSVLGRAMPDVTDIGLPAVTGVVVVDSTDAIVATATDVRRWSARDRSERWRTPITMVSGLMPFDDQLVVGTTDTGAVLIAIADGQIVARLGSLPAATGGFVVSGLITDRRWLALKGPAGDVEVWDVPARRRRGRLHTDLPSGYAIASPDGDRVAVSGSGASPLPAILFDLDTGKPIVELCSVAEPCGRVPPAAGGGVLALSRENTYSSGVVKVFDWSGRLGFAVELDTPAYDLEIVAEAGALAIITADGEVVVRDLATGARRWSATSLTTGYGLQVDRQRAQVWAFGRDGSVATFDLARGVVLGWWRLPRLPIELHFLPGAGHALCIDTQLRVWQWSPAAMDTQVIAPTPGRVWRAAWLDDGRLVSGSTDGTIAIHDPATMAVTRTLRGHTGRVVELVPLPGGRRLSADRDDDVIVWDLGTGTAVARFDDVGPRAAASPDGTAVVTGDRGGVVRVHSLAAATRARVLGRLGRPTIAVAWSPDGRQIAAISEGGEVEVWRAADGSSVRHVDGEPDPTEGGINVLFSPDSRWLAMGRASEPIVLDLVAGGSLALPGATATMVWGLAFSGDSSRLATSTDAGAITVWSLPDGKPVMQAAAASTTLAVAFAPDQRTLVTGALDHTVRVWDSDTGAALATFDAPDEVYGLRWNRGGDRVAIMTLGPAVIWRPPTAATDPTLLDELARCRSGFALNAAGVLVPSAPDPTCHRSEPPATMTR